MLTTDLPKGGAPPPVAFPHFPDRLHAFVWRNWPLVPIERMAKVVGAKPEEIRQMGKAMGLSNPPRISPDQWRRSYLTIIRRNWHLLPYDQLLQLLDWTPEQMAFTLREDDFLFVKLGNLKPDCPPLKYTPPDAAVQAREKQIARIVQETFPEGVGGRTKDPLFAFVSRLSRPLPPQRPTPDSVFSPRFCYSYFALYGDPLLEEEADPYPEGYLARLAASGVDGVWLQGVLYKLAPFPWEPERSARYEERLENLRRLVARARRHGIGIYLYLNEPRAMPLSFFTSRPEKRGVVEGDYAALCTGDPEVQKYLTDSVASICRAVPDLAGFFTITASENLTNCWSHHHGSGCPRCGQRSPAEVIAEVNARILQGIRQAGSQARLIAWDWGWQDAWAEAAINALPADISLMSVSEWSIPIRRGGVESVVGEYSISTIGPGPRALRHWEIARRRGLKTFAKIQAGNTWELSTVPYIPALANVAQHVVNLRRAGVDGLMLGWTLGGYPSPNLEVVAEAGRGTGGETQERTPEAILEAVARRRFGPALAPKVVAAWGRFSDAFREFPYHASVVYTAPMQLGPANLLWERPTGYRATMVGFPYDDLDAWRAVYPPEVFIRQMERVADGFDAALAELRNEGEKILKVHRLSPAQRDAFDGEMRVAEAATIQFRSVAQQAQFVLLRRQLAAAPEREEARRLLDRLDDLLQQEMELAHRLFILQSGDSRLGFEASNQYSYIPIDLVEKALNCRDLRERWLPKERERWEK